MKHLLLISLLGASLVSNSDAGDGSYAVVVSEASYQNNDWKLVVESLVAKHQAKVITFGKQLNDALPALKELFPRHTCFVAPSQEVTREFVGEVHALCRKFDNDAYTDTQWGILTGYDANNALAIARHQKPLIIQKVGSGTEIALQCCKEGLWYDELEKNKLVRKEQGGAAKQFRGPDDTTEAFVDMLSKYKPDLFVTSGHATERGWQIGFRYRNGFFKSKAGQMFGENTNRERLEIESPNPKVYLPVGNCLMGNIDGPDAMALAWMNDAGVKQMLGYTVPTWFGYQGWGVLDYFVEQPGRYSLTEAFFANHHALVHRLNSAATPAGEKRGLEFDRDVVAFYGDPAWIAKMADGERSFEQHLAVEDDTYTLEIKPNRGEQSFATINKNGSQRGGRPFVQFLRTRIKDVEILEGMELQPIITDDFILVPRPNQCDPSRDYRVVFRASKYDEA